MLQRILETLDSDETDIKLKSIFVEARDIVANQIAEDLAEFRHKRMIGLGSLYGEQKLTGGPAHGVRSGLISCVITKNVCCCLLQLLCV